MIRNSIITLILILSCMNVSAAMAVEGNESPAQQSILLRTGWNWISFNVQDESMVSLKALKESGVTYIASRSDFLLYDNVSKKWYGNLTSLKPTEGYTVYESKGDTIHLDSSSYMVKIDTVAITLSGIPYDVEENVTPIHKGWNWIGYIPQFSQYATTALSYFPAAQGDRLINASKKTMSYTSSWEDNFTMNPGAGYHYFSNTEKNRNLVYSAEKDDSIKGGSDSEFIEIGDSTDHFDAKGLVLTSEDDFDNSIYEYDRMMCINVYVDGEPVADPERYTISSWLNGVCRGKSSVQGLEDGKAFFMIRSWGNSSDEGSLLSFSLYDSETGKNYSLYPYNETYHFSPNNIDGRPSNAIRMYTRTKLQTDLDITVNSEDDIYELVYARVDSLAHITSLKLRGDCSSINTYIFNAMTNLEKLDLSGANGLNFTSNTLALEALSKLHTVLLPSTVNYIPSRYFYCCSNLKSITLLSFMPPSLGSEPFPDNVDTLHVTHFAHPQYVDWSGKSYFSNIVADKAEPDPSLIYISGSKTLLYTKEMADSAFTPDVTIAASGKFDLYGDTDITLGDVTLGAASSFIPHAAGTVKSASMQISKVASNPWTFFTPPFDVKVSDITRSLTSFSWIVRKYNSEKRATGAFGENWTNVAYDDTLHAGQGYIFKAAFNSSFYVGKSPSCYFTFKSTPATCSNIFDLTDRSVAVCDYKDNRSTSDNWNWNLIGNPYPSYFDIAYMDYKAPILVYTGTKYVAYSPLDDNYKLSPDQAFFIQTNGQKNVTFAQAGRSNSSIATPYGLAKAGSVDSQRKVINIILSNGSADDRTRVVSNPEAKHDYEIGRDMPKITSLETLVQLYSCNAGIRYTIDERPQVEGVILGYITTEAGTLTLSSDSRICVEDKVTGIFSEIGDNDKYEFQTQPGTFDGRFILHKSGITGIISVNNEKLTVNNEVYYNLAGQRVTTNHNGIVIRKGKKLFVK